jgi:hypothetical protein
MQYSTVTKSGRGFNGAHRESGTIVHLILPRPVGEGGFWSGKALCGTSPGQRGNGWTDSNKPASCPACLKKQRKDKPKYGLHIEGMGWLADEQIEGDIYFTPHEELAMQFAEGLDDQKTKIQMWTAVFKKVHMIKDVAFEAIKFTKQ